MKNLPDNPHIYQINLMTWLHELSDRGGQRRTLATIPDEEWYLLKEKGMHIVWLMGIWERSPDSRKRAREESSLVEECRNILPDFVMEDIVGSPYAVHAYSPDPLLGSVKDVRLLKEKLEEMGLFLVLDFVPNHTACDHSWIEHHPDFFVRKKTGKNNCDEGFFRAGSEPFGPCIAHGKDPFYPPWTDTAQLDYSNEKCVQAVIETMSRISDYCHGLRCDMAMLVMKEVFHKTWGPYLSKREGAQEFWPLAINKVKSRNEGFVFLAESYWETEHELQAQGFDYTYDKNLYDLLVAGDITGMRSLLSTPLERQKKMMRFLENHDEPRAFPTFGKEKLRCAMIIHATLPGMRLWQQGQFEGNLIRPPVQLRRGPREAVQKEVGTFCNSLLQEVAHQVFHEGTWEMRDTCGWADNQSHENLLAWCWELQEERRLIVTNFSSSPAQGYVKLPLTWFAETEQILFRDPLKGEFFPRLSAQVRQSGLYVGLESGDFHFFRIEKA